MKKVFLILVIFNFFSIIWCQSIEWAHSVISYSSYSTNGLKKQYAPEQILGTPSKLPAVGSSGAAWSSQIYDGGEEFIQVEFKNAIYVQQIAVAENYNPGSISKISLLDESNNEYIIFTNANPAPIPGLVGRMFNLFINQTTYKVKGLKLTLNTSAVAGPNEIDAIAIGDTKDSIKSIIKTIENPISGFEKENLGSNVNSSTDDLAPFISPDGKTLYFTRQDHPGNIGTLGTQDIWYATADGKGGFNSSVNIGAPINNAENNSAVGITPDGQRMLVLNVYKPDGSMTKGVSMSYANGNSWDLPIELNIKNYYNNNIYGEYNLSSSGRYLLMTVERDDSEGSKDMYVSFLQEDGSWSEPKHMGNVLNTAESETSPFLSADEKTLYFSSKGHPGYGSNDMYVSTRLDDTWTNWSEPLNLGSSINTVGWDAYFTVPANGEYAYFVSYTNSIGKADIFRQKLPASAKPAPVVLISGKVLHEKSKQPLRAKIVYENLSDGTIVGEAYSDSITGEFKIILPAGKKYGIGANKHGFFSVSENIDLTKLNEYQEIKKDLLMVPIEVGSVARLNNIFFEFNKSTLTSDSYNELKKLMKVLNQYPNMNIEIGGHTDNVGSDTYNLDLSNKRAKSVYDYLISKGVSSNRLTYKGYGKSKLIMNGDSEEANQINRRVEFSILQK